jgi:hypothetical protein
VSGEKFSQGTKLILGERFGGEEVKGSRGGGEEGLKEGGREGGREGGA